MSIINISSTWQKYKDKQAFTLELRFAAVGESFKASLLDAGI